MATEERPAIRALNRMFIEPKYPDLTISCGGKSWKLHKDIVCSHSTLFTKMLSSGLKESQDGVIGLNDDEPEAVEAMLRFMYGFGLVDDQSSLPSLVFDIHLHVLGDKYDIPALRNIAATKFEANASKGWNTEAFAQAILEVYTSAGDPERELRNVIIATASKHADTLYTKELGMPFRTTLNLVPECASELCEALVKKHEFVPRPLDNDMAVYRCFTCKSSFAMEKTLKTNMDYGCPYCHRQYRGDSWAAKKS